MANKFKKGDLVIVITGSDKGKVGNINEIKGSKVIVSGVAIRKIHKKPTQNSKGHIESRESFIHVSNVSHCSTEEKKLTRVGFSLSDGEGKAFSRKYRIAKTTGNKI